MNIAIILIHNKDLQQNESQIEDMKLLVDEKVEFIADIKNEGQDHSKAYYRTYYTFKNLDFPHEINFFHIIPYQPDNLSDPYRAVLPNNLSLLKGHNVQYGKGDENKIDIHPRFFNWGLKRGTDYGNEIIIYLEDVKSLIIEDLPFKLTQLIDPETKVELNEDSSGKIGTPRLLREVGQLNENKNFYEALIEYKEKLDIKGFKE